MKKAKIAIVIAAAVILSSCMTTKTNVGSYREQQGNEYVYSKAKQWWLFWGIVPLGRKHTATPASGNCQVITRFNFVDIVISGLTGGILTTETIKVKAKK